MASIIDIDKNRIPYSFDIKLKEKTFNFSVDYNIESDTVSVTLSKGDEVLIYNEPIILERPMFIELGYLDVPDVYIIPMDISQTQSRVGIEQLGETVFLYVIDKDLDF